MFEPTGPLTLKRHHDAVDGNRSSEAPVLPLYSGTFRGACIEHADDFSSRCPDFLFQVLPVSQPPGLYLHCSATLTLLMPTVPTATAQRTVMNQPQLREETEDADVNWLVLDIKHCLSQAEPLHCFHLRKSSLINLDSLRKQLWSQGHAWIGQIARLPLQQGSYIYSLSLLLCCY